MTTWNPDGDGDGTSHLVVTSGLWTGSSYLPAKVYSFDGSGFQQLGASTVGSGAFALGVFNGSLYVGTNHFTGSSSSSSPCVRRWNGTDFEVVGGHFACNLGAPGVFALVVYNGELVAGGRFDSAPLTPAQGIARWNGAEWQPLGSGVFNAVGGTVSALAVHNGELIVGGRFYEAGGLSVHNIAAWNGNQWHAVGDVPSLPDGRYPDITALISFGGSLYAGGGVLATNVSSPPTVFSPWLGEWNGADWSIETSLGERVTSFTVLHGVLFESDALGVHQLAPEGWMHVASSPPGIRALVAYRTELAMGGTFASAGGMPSRFLARWTDFCICDPIDFNHDTLFPDIQDIADFVSVFGGGVCAGQQPGDPPCNADIDFNNDALFPDTSDVTALLRVFAGGPCDE